MQTFRSGPDGMRAVRTAALIIVLLTAPLCTAQTKSVPAIDARTLNGDKVNLPTSAKKRPVVLVFGFARSAKGEGEAWGKELIELQQRQNSFDFFQVAALSRAPRFAQGLIARAIRASVPPAYYSHMLLLTESDKTWRGLLHVSDEGSAYVVLCSSSGNILWQARGAGQDQFDALRSLLQTDVD